jgi:hypothetical protein
MYILVEIFEFIDSVIRDVGRCKESLIYKLIEKLLKKNDEDLFIGIPVFVLFNNMPEKNIIHYIDIIRYDHCKYSIVYDERNEMFVFKGVSELFYGMKEIFRKINLIYDDDVFIQDRLKQIKLFLQIVKQSIALDDLCESFSSL